MMKDILLVVEAISNEKNLEKDVIFEAVESAMASVVAKDFEEGADVRVLIDRDTGAYDAFRCYTIVQDDFFENQAAEGVADAADVGTDMVAAAPAEMGEEVVPALLPGRCLTLSQAREMDAGLQVGDLVEQKIEVAPFGRVAVNHARHIIKRMVGDAEKTRIIELYKGRIGELITGQVKRVTRDGIYLELRDGVEAFIPREHMIPRESVRLNDRVSGYFYAVDETRKHPPVLLSRTCPEMLVKLFEIEVPEIGERVIEVRSVVRIPGYRAKVAVKTNDGRIDATGACVGMRGSRVQAVSAELNGERIDILLWDDNPAQLFINAMSPAEISAIVLDEEKKTMDVAVPVASLSQAIGRNGENVRLVSDLTGWTIEVMSEEEAGEKNQAAAVAAKSTLTRLLDIDEEIADILVQEGFSTVEDIAYAAGEELSNVEEFDDEIVNALRDRAKKALLTQVILGDKPLEEPAADLLALMGMTDEIARALAKEGIITQEDLARQAVEDVIDIPGLTEALAADLIMEARKPWFASEETNE